MEMIHGVLLTKHKNKQTSFIPELVSALTGLCSFDTDEDVLVWGCTGNSCGVS